MVYRLARQVAHKTTESVTIKPNHLGGINHRLFLGAGHFVGHTFLATSQLLVAFLK